MATVHLVIIPGTEQIPSLAQATGPQSHDMADPERFRTTIHSLAILFKIWERLKVVKCLMKPPAWPAMSKYPTYIPNSKPKTWCMVLNHECSTRYSVEYLMRNSIPTYQQPYILFFII